MVFVTDDKLRVTALCLMNMKPIAESLGQKNYLDSETTPCIADFIFFEFIEYGLKLTGDNVWQAYPTLEAYHNRMANLPGVKEFRESDKFIKDTYTPDVITRI